MQLDPGSRHHGGESGHGIDPVPMRVYGLFGGIRKQLCPDFGILAERKGRMLQNQMSKREPAGGEQRALFNTTVGEAVKHSAYFMTSKRLRLGKYEREKNPPVHTRRSAAERGE